MTIIFKGTCLNTTGRDEPVYMLAESMYAARLRYLQMKDEK